jgi:hypothetical protein
LVEPNNFRGPPRVIACLRFLVHKKHHNKPCLMTTSRKRYFFSKTNGVLKIKKYLCFRTEYRSRTGFYIHVFICTTWTPLNYCSSKSVADWYVYPCIFNQLVSGSILTNTNEANNRLISLSQTGSLDPAG